MESVKLFSKCEETMKLFSKAPFNNSWFWVCVGLFVSMCAVQLILELCRDREDALKEFVIKCPDGFIAWENSEFELTNRFEVHGDSLIEFEKRTESGCRPFDFTNVPRATVDSLLNVHSVIHYTWVEGMMNLSDGLLIKADTTTETKPHKYR